MKLRIKGPKLELVTVEGKVVGKVTELVIELDRPPADLDPEQTQLAIESANVVRSIWEHYCSLMAPRNKALNDEARAVIRAALKVATAEECRQAISGCAASDFHMRSGEYMGRSGPKYNRLTQILKGKRGGRTTREQIDFFIDIGRKSEMDSGSPSEDSVKIRDAKRDVLAAHEFPDDEHTVRRGIEAREWLTERGWKIGRREADEWPTFEPPPQAP